MNDFVCECLSYQKLQSVTVQAACFDEAYCYAIFAMNANYGGYSFPFKITNCKALEVRIVLSDCPECATAVFNSDEWKITDKTGVFEHVDCHHPERVTEAEMKKP